MTIVVSQDAGGILRIPRYPEDTIGVLGICGVLRTPALSWGCHWALVSWGCHWCPEDTGVLISIKRRFLYCPSTHHSKAVRVRGCSRKSAKVPRPTTPCRLSVSLSCAASPRAAHTTAASPPRASAPHVQELRGRLALLLFASCSQSKYDHTK